MEDQIISYKTAKLAKEKGFAENCFNYWNTHNEQGIFTKNGFLGGYNREYDNWNGDFAYMHNKDEKVYSAPTQSLLQKWLREIHNIHIIISREYDMGNQFYVPNLYYYVVHKELFSSEMFPDTEYNSYETALEAALQTSLKEIK